MLRLMGKASSGRNPASSTPEEKPMYREVFVPPETSIMDYFMVKVGSLCSFQDKTKNYSSSCLRFPVFCIVCDLM